VVSLNFTLVIELILFLIFLWGTNKFILRPTVKTIDQREDLVRHNEQSTERDAVLATDLEAQHSIELSRLYRETEERVRDARRMAMNARSTRVQEEMKQADAEIAQFRTEVLAEVDQQRTEARNLAPQVAQAIESHLDRGVRV
jgi:F-type H+-transporting ATPase subunit b